LVRNILWIEIFVEFTLGGGGGGGGYNKRTTGES